MDKITQSYLTNFASNLGLQTGMSENLLFEYFAAYTMISKYVNNNLLKDDLEAMSTGNAKGVDSISFCINEKLIVNSDEIDNFGSQSLFVDIYFIQAKISENFNDSELGNFLDVVIDFFRDEPKYNITEFESHREIYKRILEKLGHIRTLNLHCLYITLGQAQNGRNSLAATTEIKKDELQKCTACDNIEILLIDKSTLITEHKKVISPTNATFKFENKIPLNGIENVEEAYIGFIPFAEYKNLIMDSDSNKLKSLFNDNLRDFLGIDNPINMGIKQTLDNKKFNEFSLLNNGITIIADNNRGKGNTLILDNYQIVNGCQTSNVLYECKDIEGIDKVMIPLKVVITTNEALRDEIILTTNSQSKFTEEQLFAITQFQKTLEDYYRSQQHIDNLYYERRTNQYHSLGISRNNIIEIKEQLKSFMAIFYELPHLVAGNIGKVVNLHKNEFFLKEHSPIPYYVAGLMSAKWEELLSKYDQYKDYNKYRYHIFMGVRYLVEDLTFNTQFLSNIKKYAIKQGDNRINSYDKLLTTLRDIDILRKYIDQTIAIFIKCDYTRPKAAYSNPITQSFKDNIQTFLNQD